MHEGHSCTLKIYSIEYGDDEFDRARFEPGLELAIREIPPADQSAGRFGVGFAILHQGKTGDYVVLSWWDRENELPTRVFLRDGRQWRPADTSESFCVWDIEVICFERGAYLNSVLCKKGASMQDYLAAHIAT